MTAKHFFNHRRHHRHFFWLFLPFRALWFLISAILGVTGRLIGIVVGLVFIVVGIIVSLTIVGAIVGIPLAIVGLLMLLGSIF